MKNSQTSTPSEAHEPSKVGGRSPYFLWLIWVIWLPFITQPIIGLLQAHAPLPRLIATLVVVVLFFVIYLWATWQNVHYLLTATSSTKHTPIALWWPIISLTVLCLMLAWLGSIGNGWLTPFIFTSAYVSGRLPTMRAIPAIIVLALLTFAAGRLTDNSSYDIGQAMVFVTVVGIVTISLARSITTGRELRAAREEIARLAVMTERLRIARDLHDLLGHNLSLIALKSELARRLVAVSPERAITEISDVEQVARTTLQEVREAVASYRQPTLLSELHSAQEILAAAGITYRYDSDESIIGTLPTAVESVLAWAVREGVTNVIRHSRAHQCMIRVGQNMHDTWVEVTDDGTGAKHNTDNGGNGLRGLVERVEALGGRCEASSPAGGGFCLSVSVPHTQGNSDTEQPKATLASYMQRSASLKRADSDGQGSQLL